jgi:serine/threonine-protein kinase
VIEGKWAIERELGHGGMGTVYLAQDLDLGRRVAIKMLSKHLLNEGELVVRFEREARMMARLDHPNLVPIYAVGRHQGTPFIVMKFLEGKSLADLLAEKKRLSGAAVLPLVKQLCEGLHFVHDQRVVHRDLKPANIFVSPSGHVTLLDLGVARDTDNNMTRTGMMMGTPRYMAPEQITGHHPTPAADLYALATVCFELLTGRPVFQAETDFELMRAHVDTMPPDAATIVALPPGVGAVLRRGMAKDPAQRYPSALHFYDALEVAWNSGPPAIVAPEPAPVRAAAALATPAPTTASNRFAGLERPHGTAISVTPRRSGPSPGLRSTSPRSRRER